MKVDVVALVLDLHEPAQHLVAGKLPALLQQEHHPVVGLRRAEAVDAGDAGDDDDVAALQKRAGRRVAQLVDLLVDGRVLLDVGVRAGDVGLGLIVVVIADEILHRVFGEEGLELPVELGGQRLVVGQDEGRALHGLNDVGDREGLARAGHAEKHLVPGAFRDARHEAFDGLRLIAPGLELGDHFESAHEDSPFPDPAARANESRATIPPFRQPLQP